MPEEQCESFDATRISLVQYGDFWKILSGAEELYDFGNKEKEATRALLALRHHEFNYKCIVGSTGASFRYLRR
jgi:hypothetical protein